MTKELPFVVVHRYSGFEVRDYPAHVLVQVSVDGTFSSAGNIGFRPLISYISGNNIGGERIAMTAPVIQQPRNASRHLVSFVLPEDFDVDSVPVPRDRDVNVVPVQAHRVAVRPFKGGWSEARFDDAGKALLEAVTREGLTPNGGLYFARFDPPWTPPFLKRNEVLVDLDESAAPPSK
jgi:hypothetical protein